VLDTDHNPTRRICVNNDTLLCHRAQKQGRDAGPSGAAYLWSLYLICAINPVKARRNKAHPFPEFPEFTAGPLTGYSEPRVVLRGLV